MNDSEDKTTDNKGATERVREELERRYQPKSVREWIAGSDGNAELALERAVDMLNTRIQRQIKAETEAAVAAESAAATIKEWEQKFKDLKARSDAMEADLQRRDAEARAGVIKQTLESQFPDKHHEIQVALSYDGWELDVEGDAVMAVQGDKRHRLATVLNDEFYKRHPFARPGDEAPLGGGKPKGDSDLAKLIAAQYAGAGETIDWSN